MNIFVLDKNIKKAAQYHCDKHVVKMIVEYAQLLSSAHHLSDSAFAKDCYKLTHKNHPCAIWVRESKANYIWLYNLFNSLCAEYTARYNKVHKTYIEKGPVLQNVPDLSWKGLTPFPQAMPEEFRRDDAVEAYRAYYRGAKKEIATWKTKVPEWFN